MIEPIAEMPQGTIGILASGEITREDYREVLVPALHTAADAGGIRILFAFGPEFERYQPGALLEDAKAGIDMGLVHRIHWVRCAVVSDVGWISKAVQRFGWLAPGEVSGFSLDRLEEAKAWVAG